MINRGGMVYAFSTDQGFVKIGASAEPEKRLKCIEKTEGVKIIEKFISPKIKGYFLIEGHLKKHFIRQRIKGEWFLVNLGDVVKIIKEIISENKKIIVKPKEEGGEEQGYGYAFSEEMNLQYGVTINKLNRLIRSGKIDGFSILNHRKLLVSCASLKEFFSNKKELRP